MPTSATHITVVGRVAGTNRAMAALLGDPFALQAWTPLFETTVSAITSGPAGARYAEVQQSLTRTPEQVQKAHLNFLNTVLPNVPGR